MKIVHFRNSTAKWTIDKQGLLENRRRKVGEGQSLIKAGIVLKSMNGSVTNRWTNENNHSNVRKAIDD